MKTTVEKYVQKVWKKCGKTQEKNIKNMYKNQIKYES